MFFRITLIAGQFAATARIPNALTYPAILIGLALSLVTAAAMGHSTLAINWLGKTSESPMLESLYGFGVCLGIGIISVMFNGIHAGDMKLIAAMGAIFGLHDVCVMLLWALAAAIPMALINLLIQDESGHSRITGPNYYLLFMGLMLLNSVLFVVYARGYREQRFVQGTT